MTTTEEVPMPGITIAIREDGIPRSLQGGFYTADQLRAYADARIAALQAELDQCRQLERAAMEGIRRADEFAAAMGNSMREAGCTIEGFEIKNVRAEKAEAERDALAEKAKAMEDELDHAIRVLSKTCRWPDCNCPQSMGTGHLHCERQPIHVIEPSKQGAEAERDALAEKVKAMEGLARRALKCLREEVVPLEQDSIDIINSTIIDFQSVLYATPVDAAIDAAGGDQC